MRDSSRDLNWDLLGVVPSCPALVYGIMRYLPVHAVHIHVYMYGLAVSLDFPSLTMPTCDLHALGTKPNRTDEGMASMLYSPL